MISRQVVAFSCLLVTVLSAGVDLFYPYGVGLDQELELGDDVSSEKFTLKWPIVFYGERKYDVWVGIGVCFLHPCIYMLH